jgi:hypothetical protein
MNDRERVLNALRERGSLTSYEIRTEGLSGNPSQRINELRDLGFKIDGDPASREVDGKKRPMTVYTLLSDRTVGKGDRVDAQGVEHECGSLAGLERPAQSSNVRVVSPHSLGGPATTPGLVSQGNGREDGDFTSSSSHRLSCGGGSNSSETSYISGSVAAISVQRCPNPYEYEDAA